MNFVLDNSVALAWCFEDEHTQPIIALLHRVTESGAFVPQLWPIEALNGLLTAERKGRISLAERRKLIGFLRQLPISIDDETANRTWLAIAELAQDHGLTAYDAAYLELAVRLRLPLATSDKQLMSAARAAGVDLLLDRA